MPPLLLLLLLGGAYTVAKQKSKQQILSLKPELYILDNCKTFSFSDGTGDRWWNSKGRKIAQEFVKITSDRLYIAFGILNEIYRDKISPNCFKYAYQKSVPNGFPMLDFGDLTPQDIGLFDQKALELKRISWIRNNFQMWNLIWQVRNKVDKEFFNGVETVELDPKNIGKQNIIITNNNFNYNKLWNDFLKSISIAALNVEQKKQGSLIPWLNDKDVQWHVAVYLMRILFPYIVEEEFKKWVNMGGENISQSQLFKNILDSIDNLVNDEIDMEF